ncbi:MAG: tRNA 2-thiocytidine biosynthesis protein TtcA, partial [Clostridia bacterium]|nr:tRNA 2-thiocytidine biosynthesis protein TtcA [Clostridia bacterium]
MIKKIKDNAKILGVDIEIFDSDIFEVANKLAPEAPCYMCARMRRGFLYSKAKELGCNKIALGHHFNDVIETSLLALLYSSEIKTMLPKLHSDNFPGLELIRPLYLVREDDIISFARYNELNFINCACKFTENDK